MAEQMQGLSENEKRAWLALFAAAALMNRKLDQQLKDEAQLTYAQYEVLSRLSGAPDRELRMTELSEALFTTRSGETYQIAQLVKSGYVRRKECSNGGLAVWAVLTDSGLEVLKQAAPGHVRAVRNLLIDVLTPGELDAVASGLGRVRDHILDQVGYSDVSEALNRHA